MNVLSGPVMPVLGIGAVFAVMFALGLGIAAGDMLWVRERPALLVRGLLSVLVAVPLLALAVIQLVALPRWLEVGLMLFSVLVAAAGIGIATMFYLRKPGMAEAWAQRFSGVHRLLLGKYFVDEAYDAAVVQPIKRTSTGLLWRGVDAGLIDGTVNGVGLIVRGWSAVLRRLQTGSVRAYAMSVFVGVVVILSLYIWR